MPRPTTDDRPIDCDLHPTVPAMSALMPYLDEVWRETVVRRGIDELNTIAYPSNSPLTVRSDWRDASGKPATTAERLGTEALDPFGTGIAICNCLYGVQATFSEDLGAAMARAVNDWIAREWLDRDPRLRASIVVPQQNAELAVAEIERCAADRRFVQVLLLVSGELPLGRRQNWPIYAAAERHGLTLGIHAGSTYRHPNTPVGWSSYYSEEYINQAGAFQTQLTSLITEGVFAKFPDLTVVLMESGRDLAARLSLASDEILEGAAQRGALGRRSARHDRARTGPPDARSRSTGRRIRPRSPGSWSIWVRTNCCCSPPTIRTGSSRGLPPFQTGSTRASRERSWSTIRCGRMLA